MNIPLAYFMLTINQIFINVLRPDYYASYFAFLDLVDPRIIIHTS